MITFEKIRWKNFLSTGNQFTEIDFTKTVSTLVIGSNGAGKSTLYGTIIGQYKVDAGNILLNQKDITEKPIHERAKLGIAYLSQYRSVFNMSVFDNLLGICLLYTSPSPRDS